MRAPAIATPHRSVPAALMAASLGMIPVLCLAAEAFGALPMWLGALLLALPGAVALAGLGLIEPALGRRILVGLLAGTVACIPYDAVRLGALALGLMDADPVPGFGEALGLSPAWLAGYAWRFIGDGGGMGVAFAALGLTGFRRGALFGAVIGGCLFATLAVSAHGETLLFPLTPTTVLIAGIGHLIWGGALGSIVAALDPGDRRALQRGRGSGKCTAGASRADLDAADTAASRGFPASALSADAATHADLDAADTAASRGFRASALRADAATHADLDTADTAAARGVRASEGRAGAGVLASLARWLPRTPDGALSALLVLTVAFFGVQIVGAAASGSLALLSDAAHAGGDLGVLALATGAAVLARRLRRPDLSGALQAGAAALNGIALLAIAGWLAFEAIERIEGHDHGHVSGPIMLAVAIAGVAVDGIGIALLARFVRRDLNVRGVVLHLLADAGGSVGAAIAAGLVVAGFPLADPVAGLLLAGLVAVAAVALIRDVVRYALAGGESALEHGCRHHAATSPAPPRATASAAAAGRERSTSAG